METPSGTLWNERIRRERIERNWRQQDLAEHLGTTVVTVQRWERGSQYPSAYFRVKLCALFEKSATELGLIPQGALLATPPQAEAGISPRLGLQDEDETTGEQFLDAIAPQQVTAAAAPPLPALQQSSLPPLLDPVRPSQGRWSRRRMLVGLAGGTIAIAAGASLLSLHPGQQAPARLRVPVQPLLLGTTLCDYRGHHLMVRGVAWSPDGKYIVSAGIDPTIRIWMPDSETGHTIHLYAEHHQKVNAVAWSPDSTRIASAINRNVHIWDISSGERILIYQGHTDSVQAIAWSADSHSIVSASQDGTAQVWNALTGNSEQAIVYRGHKGGVLAAAWSPQSQQIASGGDDGIVQVWEAFTGRPVYTYHGHQSMVPVHTVAWAPDGSRIASGSADKTVQVWDAATGTHSFMKTSSATRVVTVAWSPDNRLVAFGGYDQNTVQVIDPITGHFFFTYAGHSSYVHTLAWAPDGTRIASGGLDTTVHVWQAR